MVLTKICTNCRIEKNLEEFSYNKHHGSYNSQCKHCLNLASMERYYRRKAGDTSRKTRSDKFPGDEARIRANERMRARHNMLYHTDPAYRQKCLDKSARIHERMVSNLETPYVKRLLEKRGFSTQSISECLIEASRLNILIKRKIK